MVDISLSVRICLVAFYWNGLIASWEILPSFVRAIPLKSGEGKFKSGNPHEMKIKENQRFKN